MKLPICCMFALNIILAHPVSNTNELNFGSVRLLLWFGKTTTGPSRSSTGQGTAHGLGLRSDHYSLVRPDATYTFTFIFNWKIKFLAFIH